MYYLANLNKEKYLHLKETHKHPTVGFVLNQWVNHLADRKNFSEFFNHKMEMTKMDSVVGYHKIKLIVNREKWTAFLKNCREYNMSGNYVLNLLLEEYSKKGHLFKIEITV